MSRPAILTRPLQRTRDRARSSVTLRRTVRRPTFFRTILVLTTPARSADWIRSGNVSGWGAAATPTFPARSVAWARRYQRPGSSAASSMCATSRVPSSLVGTDCQVFDPSRLSSIWPPAIPDTLSATATETCVGSPLGALSKASAGASGSWRSRTGCEA